MITRPGNRWRVAGSLPEERLESLYTAPGFGGETTSRARVIRELIDEIRRLRRLVDDPRGFERGPAVVESRRGHGRDTPRRGPQALRSSTTSRL